MPKDETFDLLEPTPQKKASWKWIVALLALLLVGGATYYLISRGSGKPDTQVGSGNTVGPAQVAAANASPAPASSPSPASTINPAVGGAGTLAASKAETVNFGFDQAEVLPGSTTEIRSLWNEIKGKATTVNIEGHTDNLGPDWYNQKLSELRAKKVALLLRQLGMDQKFKVNVRGFGHGKPAADNATGEGRARNRRVEISSN
jgi:OOP family OmpA-OmpF porin